MRIEGEDNPGSQEVKVNGATSSGSQATPSSSTRSAEGGMTKMSSASATADNTGALQSENTAFLSTNGSAKDKVRTYLPAMLASSL